MNVNTREYRQKLRTYSKSTIQKLTDLVTSKETLWKIYKVVMESNTEQEVIEKLNYL